MEKKLANVASLTSLNENSNLSGPTATTSLFGIGG